MIFRIYRTALSRNKLEIVKVTNNLFSLIVNCKRYQMPTFSSLFPKILLFHRRAPSRSYFFHFHVVFGRNFDRTA